MGQEKLDNLQMTCGTLYVVNSTWQVQLTTYNVPQVGWRYWTMSLEATVGEAALIKSYEVVYHARCACGAFAFGEKTNNVQVAIGVLRTAKGMACELLVLAVEEERLDNLQMPVAWLAPLR